MTVSVIIPTRNRKEALKGCLNSLRNQTELPDEVVIVGYINDSSEEKFLSELSESFEIQYIKTNAGACTNRNLGINNAKGDILVFLDDDVIIEKNYIKSAKKILENESVDVVNGYTFDLVDLITPWVIRPGDIRYISNNKNDEFIKLLLDKVSKRYPGKLYLIENKSLLAFVYIMKSMRNVLKSLILQEWPVKGKILPSGYRSEMPDITAINGLCEVEWIQGGNFVAKKNVVNAFKFDERIELYNYALGDDLEFSARVGKNYPIFISSDMKVIHLRYPSGRLNERERFKSIVINFNKISKLRGNNLAFGWSVLGLLLSRIAIYPFDPTQSASAIMGIIDGVKKLGENNMLTEHIRK